MKIRFKIPLKLPAFSPWGSCQCSLPRKCILARHKQELLKYLFLNLIFFLAMLFSQLNSSHMLHFSTPRISSPILRTMSPIAYLSIHSDPLREAGLPRSQSAESHSSSSRSTGHRQLPVIPCGNKFPPVIRISKAQLQQVNKPCLHSRDCTVAVICKV